MNPVLVELPHEVLHIEALSDSTSVASWQHPVVLTLDSSFVVVNVSSFSSRYLWHPYVTPSLDRANQANTFAHSKCLRAELRSLISSSYKVKSKNLVA